VCLNPTKSTQWWKWWMVWQADKDDGKLERDSTYCLYRLSHTQLKSGSAFAHCALAWATQLISSWFWQVWFWSLGHPSSPVAGPLGISERIFLCGPWWLKPSSGVNYNDTCSFILWLVSELNLLFLFFIYFSCFQSSSPLKELCFQISSYTTYIYIHARHGGLYL
jgi:hypothetical protein